MSPVPIFLGIAALALMAGGKKKSRFIPPEYDGPQELRRGEYFPDVPQHQVVAKGIERFASSSPHLIRNRNHRIVYKDEEGTGADLYMTPRLAEHLNLLAKLVQHEWPGVKLRVTEAWDPEGEHSKKSVHYEGRGADITTSDIDLEKYGRLSGLAIQAGFEWVFYEDKRHVHVSVGRDW